MGRSTKIYRNKKELYNQNKKETKDKWNIRKICMNGTEKLNLP